MRLRSYALFTLCPQWDTRAWSNTEALLGATRLRLTNSVKEEGGITVFCAELFIGIRTAKNAQFRKHDDAAVEITKSFQNSSK
jgi:hypothetical protein